MIKYILTASLVALTGCSKNQSLEADVFKVAEVGCKAYNSKVKSVAGKLWFPTFKEELVVVCSKEGANEDLVLSLEFKAKR